jgi:hypothetical protein
VAKNWLWSSAIVQVTQQSLCVCVCVCVCEREREREIERYRERERGRGREGERRGESASNFFVEIESDKSH